MFLTIQKSSAEKIITKIYTAIELKNRPKKK